MPSYDAQGFYRDEQGNIAPDPRTGDIAPAMSQAISNLFGTSYTPGRAWDPSMGDPSEFDPNVPHDPTALATGRSTGGTFMPQQIGMVGGPTLPKGIQADIDAQEAAIEEETGGQGNVWDNVMLGVEEAGPPAFHRRGVDETPPSIDAGTLPTKSPAAKPEPEAPVQDDEQGILMSALMETLRSGLGIGGGSDARQAAEARGEDYDATKYGEGFLADVNRFIGAPLDALPGLPTITAGAPAHAPRMWQAIQNIMKHGIIGPRGRVRSIPMGWPGDKARQAAATVPGAVSTATYSSRNPPGGEAAQAPEAVDTKPERVGTKKVRPITTTTTAAPQRSVNQRGQPIR